MLLNLPVGLYTAESILSHLGKELGFGPDAHTLETPVARLLSDMLSSLAERGFITRDGRRYTVHDPAKLYFCPDHAARMYHEAATVNAEFVLIEDYAMTEKRRRLPVVNYSTWSQNVRSENPKLP